MKKIFLSVCLVLALNAQNLQIDKIRTDLYSKNGSNVLKKIEISLEFVGNDLEENKLIDATNTVISGFFYEDIFTELGKDNFKKILEKFLDKKYKIKLEDIYILSLNTVEKFDLEEFKRFLQSTEVEEKNKNDETKALKDLKSPQIPHSPSEKESKQIDQLFKDVDEENENNKEEINLHNLNIPRMTFNLDEKMKQDLIAKLLQIFEENNISKSELSSPINHELELD
ncbi:hypothetical protein LNU06_05000 [Campylobacter sp. VicNov18]|uniref:hypothetical protein n=1 Tax=Campylobacter bilis TaxID=2691918 RepID=UPI00130E1AB8|nr:hypothetical protein [Campylobacter bilis]MPV63879.1 hypothetical protein [Campylobacter hepaticus]MBM0637380.1 hypothetical protein [Campylobacter bilis]MCC8278101.1 hypothetical protein [Campylobacter bilis]MCC8299605.1 hypothetical protein [Campylobacter bilis]MCC8301010.1 hypothetical protein [Campylobacter bilis]